MGLFDKLKSIINKKENIEVKDENVQKYDEGLEKSRNEFVSKLSMLGIKYTKINDEYFDELENILIMADIGVNTVMDFMDRLRKRVKSENITDTKYLNEVIVDELFIIYVNNESITDKINMAEDGPTVILMVGVNGVGKTTTIAKLAHKYKNEGKKVMLIAGDTFRAGAVEQLKIWADRTNSLFYGKENTDPAGVIYDGLLQAKENNAEIVLIDTAGRLHNKVNLMKELEKINEMISLAKPDLLFVCFCAPNRAHWIYDNYKKYDAKVSICAGATVDFLAGNVKRAPKWMSNVGLEWFYRFLQEPKRLFKRYFIDDMKIIKLVFKYK